MNIWKILKRETRRRLTIMLIPHNSIKPLKITFSLTFLLSMMATWTFLTISAGYMYSRHIDYIRVKADNKLMHLKVTFFAEKMKQSQEMLDQVKANDERVRTLLGMKSKRAIVEAESEGRGGPTRDEEQDLERLLSGKTYEITSSDIERQTKALEQETAQRMASYKEIMQHVTNERYIYRATPNLWPCNSARVTSTFGFRIHPIYQDNDFHAGMDIAGPYESPIYATADGTVRFSDWQPGYGRLIIIDHQYGYRTYYGHLAKALVKTREKVHRGQMIGLMGSTGTSTGTHVHYEIQHNGSPTNPAKFLSKYPSQLSKATRINR
jgi:murein DD-endopeptidase MepM/ murein hydrolase activator NlpD